MYFMIEQNKESFIDFLKHLITFRSYSGQEGEIASFIFEEFGKTDVDESFIDGIGNVCGIIRGTGQGPDILMISHMDIVPEDSLKNWEPFDPFVPEIRDGKLYGRGTSDMKGGLACQFYAMKVLAEALKKNGLKPPGDISLVCTVQEESAGFAGANWFFDHTMKEKDIRADFVYLAEPLAQRGDAGTAGQGGDRSQDLWKNGSCLEAF